MQSVLVTWCNPCAFSQWCNPFSFSPVQSMMQSALVLSRWCNPCLLVQSMQSALVQSMQSMLVRSVQPVLVQKLKISVLCAIGAIKFQDQVGVLEIWCLEYLGFPDSAPFSRFMSELLDSWENLYHGLWLAHSNNSLRLNSRFYVNKWYVMLSHVTVTSYPQTKRMCFGS